MLRLSPRALAAASPAVKGLLDARASRAVIPLKEWQHTPASIDQAYQVQEEYLATAQLGPRIGYKIGATNAGARAGIKVDEPFYGVLVASLATQDNAAFSAAQLYQRLVEAEVALVMGEDLSAVGGKPVTAEMVRAATETVKPAIEIVDSPFGAEWKESTGLNIIADNGAHGRFIVGSGTAPAAGFDAEGLKVELFVNGKLEREGAGKAVDGGAFAATAWLVNTLAKRGLGLKRGEIVTTGTTIAPLPANAGDEVRAVFNGLGTVTIRFE